MFFFKLTYFDVFKSCHTNKLFISYHIRLKSIYTIATEIFFYQCCVHINRLKGKSLKPVSKKGTISVVL